MKKFLLASVAALMPAASFAADGATVAFLMPDQASTRYEQHDYPGFQAEMTKLCATCTVTLLNLSSSLRYRSPAASWPSP